ncbi:MAG: zinc-dependent metalloprotease [Verrucomicrobiales bacterium]
MNSRNSQRRIGNCLRITLAILAWASCPAQEVDDEKAPKTIESKTKSLTRTDGYFSYYWDAREGKLWLHIDRWDEEFLYVSSLAAGVGSNDIGLDRGQLGRSAIVRFERVGPKVMLIESNYAFRALSENEAEGQAVKEAFAESTLWGFKVAAEEGDSVLVDATEFFLRDAHGVARVLKQSEQGAYKMDTSRSSLYLPRTKNFPRNTEVEATLTFVGEPKGGFIRRVVPSPEAVTIRQHHSFIELPDGNYEPRPYDPRAGFFSTSFMDFATPIDEPIEKRYLARHRLKKKDPASAVGEPVEPIVYYLDPGAPEPIRSALLEGARWWEAAFEAAGYRGAFRVEMLPDGADPMDVRYNVIQWVHRSTRGWSYGASVRDPRTGEIIKGHVTLGSLRVRQDFLIAEGLLAPYEVGAEKNPAMLELALARLRQLSAHEVGHTLGLAHNFASSVNGRTSVMDYPHPLVKLRSDGAIDVSDAYSVGIGEWDKAAIEFGYRDFPESADVAAELKRMIAESIADGHVFISDADARAPGGAHPAAHLWDNGANPAEELQRVMAVRAAVLKRFGERNIRPGAPMSTLEEALVPIYYYHRYQLEAAAKLVGGVDYRYASRGDGQKVIEVLAPELQRQAIQSILATLTPESLALSDSILNSIPPRTFGTSRGRETFSTRTGVTFDPIAAAETAAGMAMRLLLHPQRATRLVQHHSQNADNPSLRDLINRLLGQTWWSSHEESSAGELARAVDGVVLHQLMDLATAESASHQARAVAFTAVKDLGNSLEHRFSRDLNPSQRAHCTYGAAQIERFLRDPTRPKPPAPPRPPDGSPIGMCCDVTGSMCQHH